MNKKAEIEFEQKERVYNVMRQYLISDWSKIKAFKTGNELLHRERLIPQTFIHRMLSGTPIFQRDNKGPTLAIKKCLEMLTNDGLIKPVSGMFYGFAGKCFVISNLHDEITE